MEQTARSIRLDLHRVDARSPTELAPAFTAVAQARAGALAIYDDALFLAEIEQLANLARKHKLPTIGPVAYVKAGGLPPLE